MADDGDVPGKHFLFIPDPVGHTYIIAANNGFMFYAGNDGGGGDLAGLFAGQITPANCGFRIAKAYWVLEPVPGQPGFFYIRNVATGDHLQIDWPHTNFGDSPTLIDPRGLSPEQWELIPHPSP
jgi:hypothetical protein